MADSYANSYRIEISIIYVCQWCATQQKYDHTWTSTDSKYIRFHCVECNQQHDVDMYYLKGGDYYDYHWIIDVAWNYFTSKPENVDAVEGKIAWVSQ